MIIFEKVTIFEIFSTLTLFFILGTDNIDLSNYPSKELQYDWLKEYLTVYNGTKEVSDIDIHNLYVQVNKFALISSVFWGMWSLVQAANSTIDFDFIE